ncbi:maleylpyruvate isomerase family mycothiol-dependent enzyme [Nocardioides guangzhouensis]|uniref:Maleylpyruvate isomerase family mycothiol-dependent enzyme n=1 Tax=Nocardioides guangzhouensis TaxID=2497878 RepID=A0A4Q4ZDB5_9ACTN|nr:maleylpyruvate isomerase family mycothiol-dependent enzyme [Nocardioides guangzhouensis]RYP85346.1 maleylpyruvate isomerase family mycothiol-dependent enzyme [Nocardioides guangzhouensis]
MTSETASRDVPSDTQPTSDAPDDDGAARLATYVDVWWHAVDDFTKVLEAVPADAWDAPTDLPGWDVHAVAAHIAHLEGVLSGAPEETVDVGTPAHVTGLMGLYTEQGVVARRDRSPDELITEIREAATSRHTALLADPPTDPGATPERIFGGIGWSWERLLRNRPLDVWMHEQDVRRAVGLPGGLDSVAAQHTADYLVESLGLVVGKRVAPPAGTTVVLDVAGSAPYAVRVGDDGRARPVDPPAHPTVRIRLDREDFVVVAGGRRAPTRAEVTGDEELGRAVLDSFAVTP